MIKGLGIDMIELERIGRVFDLYGQRFLERIYTEGEREYIQRWADPVPRIAGRFAVKEACMKALGTGWSRGVRWRDIEVTRQASGRPEVKLHGEARRIFSSLDATEIHCTITHERSHAMAIVIFE